MAAKSEGDFGPLFLLEAIAGLPLDRQGAMVSLALGLGVVTASQAALICRELEIPFG